MVMERVSALPRHQIIITTTANQGKGWLVDQSDGSILSRDQCRPITSEERTREQLSANPFCGLKGEIRLFISSCSVVTWGKRRRMNTKFWKMKRRLKQRSGGEIMFTNMSSKLITNYWKWELGAYDWTLQICSLASQNICLGCTSDLSFYISPGKWHQSDKNKVFSGKICTRAPPLMTETLITLTANGRAGITQILPDIKQILRDIKQTIHNSLLHAPLHKP